MTLRDGMGRELGGGFRMGNTCMPMADSCECMAKTIQFSSVQSLSCVRLFATLWTGVYHTPPSMGFSRQGY